MRIFVIGGTAFTGPCIIRRLLEQGHQVTLFHRHKARSELFNNIPQIYGDRNHLSDFTDELRRLSPEIVLDMVPLSGPNAKEVVDIFAGLTDRIVAISSQDVYRAYGIITGFESGAIDPTPIAENSPLRTKYFPYREKINDRDHPLYNYDKIPIENIYMNQTDISGTILRWPMIYGPGDRQHRLFNYLKRMDDNRPAILLEDKIAPWRWTKGYVENIAESAVLAINNDKARGKIYNVGEPETLSEKDWLEAIGQAAGWTGRVISVPEYLLPENMRSEINSTQNLITDSTKIRNELHYQEIISFENGLKRTIDWERAHPPENIDTNDFNYELEDSILSKLTGD